MNSESIPVIVIPS